MNDVINGVGQLRVGEKSRSKKSEGSHSSPRTKKKSSSTTKKHHSGGDDVIDENLRLSQEANLNRSMSSRQSSEKTRRHTSSSKITKSKDGRKAGSREEDPEIPRSGDDSSRNSPMTGRHNVRSSRIDSEENGKNH